MPSLVFPLRLFFPQSSPCLPAAGLLVRWAVGSPGAMDPVMGTFPKQVVLRKATAELLRGRDGDRWFHELKSFSYVHGLHKLVVPALVDSGFVTPAQSGTSTSQPTAAETETIGS